MASLGLQGVIRGKPVRTTISDKAAPCPLDYVNRQLHAAQGSHVGLDPGLVDEDQPLRIEALLQGQPALPSPRDVGARPFKREQLFFNRRPSRCRNIQTALCETLTPRAASSSFRPCSVRCGVWPIRSMMNPRCGSRIGLRCPPILPGATEPVAR